MLRSLNKLTLSLLLAVCVNANVLNAQTANSDAASVRSAPANDALTDKIAALVTAHAELDMFSGTVLVAKNGKVIYEGAFGEANKDHNVPNRLNTRFNIGSIGKTFTAVSIMQLVEAGKLQLSDPISKFLPDFPFDTKDMITIHHLLTHSSGLGDYLEHKDYRCRMATLRKIEDALPLVYDQEPDFPPGERFQYSNSAFLLLGAIIEKVSGLPYPEYLQEHIFRPLGMKESGIAFEHEILPDRSIGYTKNWDGTYTSNALSIPPPCSAGGLRTTVRDLLKFGQALYDTMLLSEETKAKMFTPSELSPTYACGWEVKEYHGNRFVGHSGGAGGIEAFFYRFIDAGYTIITLSNYDGGNGQVCSGIEAILFGREYSLPTMADANFTLGYALQSDGKYEEAVKVFARNLKSDPPHLLSLFMSANTRILGGFELEEATVELDRYIQQASPETWPPLSMAWGKKGYALKKLGKTEEAIQCYKKVLELDPDNTNAKEKLEEMLNK
jgi:CubicO group peptidase (beta-lactamase class C family)